MRTPFSFRYQPVLGTELHVVVGSADEAAAERAQSRVLAEIQRLEAVLSTYSADSPLSRWMRAEPGVELPDEAVTVLEVAQEWYAASGGAFHPALGSLRARWRAAEQAGEPPTRAECRRLAERVPQLPFIVLGHGSGRRVERLGDCSDLDLDAVAKGWVVDRAAEAGLGVDVGWVMVNVGGDLRVVGERPVRVAVEDPASPVDNAPPLGVVTVRAGGLASSGSARRGFRVGEHWWGHVLDPRTGWPVETTSGVTVVALDTSTADVLATVVGVDGLDHPRVAALLERAQAAALVVSSTGRVQVSAGWPAYAGFVATG